MELEEIGEHVLDSLGPMVVLSSCSWVLKKPGGHEEPRSVDVSFSIQIAQLYSYPARVWI